MSDEQTIYIGPQDDLTNVRERLERIPSRRITLVIPSQTLLRSLVAWRNLYARAQELGKEVFIISSDPQIRSVAQAAKFKVASLESNPTNKTRSSGRILRPTPGGRGQSKPPTELRTPPRGTKEQREGGGLRARQPDSSPLQYPPLQPLPAQTGPESNVFPTDEFSTDTLSDALISPLSPSEHDQPYDFHFDTSPPIRPLSREQLEEEPDLFLDDVQMSHDILRAASEGNKNEPPAGASQLSSTTADSTPSAQQPPQPYSTAPLPEESDPFAYMADSEPPPLPGEQHASVSIDGFDTTEKRIQDVSNFSTDGFDTTEKRIQDVSDFSTEKIQGGQSEVIDEGDLGPIIVDADPPDRSWVDVLAESGQGTGDMAGPPPRPHGIRPRGSLMGNTSLQDDEPPRDLPPIEERPTQVIPPASPPAQEQSPLRARASAAGPAPMSPPGLRNRGIQGDPTQRKQPALSRPQSGQEMQRPGGAGRPGAGTPTGARRATTQRRATNSVAVLVASIIALLLVLGALAYLVPSATVTVALPSKEYKPSSPVTLIAKPQQPTAVGAVSAEQLTQDFPVTLNAKATSGVASAGGSTATGMITFTNVGTASLDIPTGTVVTTATGAQFATTADVVVTASGSSIGNPMQIPVQGASNADAGTVTVIPPDSLSAIAKANNVTTSDVKLQISNPSPITGGGTKQVPTVSRADIDGAKAAAPAQVQRAINAWTRQNTHAGDVAGPAIVTTTTVVKAPAAGTQEGSGSFTVDLKVSVTMLVVHNADLLTAAATVINDNLKKDKSYNGNYVVATTSRPAVTIGPVTVKGNDKSLSLSLTPKATIVPNISRQQVQQMLAGKSKSEAQNTSLPFNAAGTQYVQVISVQIWPSFINWIPFLTSRITVNFVPGTTK